MTKVTSRATFPVSVRIMVIVVVSPMARRSLILNITCGIVWLSCTIAQRDVVYILAWC